jgi:hypothetical protein
MKQDAIDDIQNTKTWESINALELDEKLDLVSDAIFSIEDKLGAYLYEKTGHSFSKISKEMTYYWLDEMSKEDYGSFLKLLDNYIYDFHQDKL